MPIAKHHRKKRNGKNRGKGGKGTRLNKSIIPQGIVSGRAKTQEIKATKITLETPLNVVTGMDVMNSGGNNKISQQQLLNNNSVIEKAQIKGVTVEKSVTKPVTKPVKARPQKQIKTTKTTKKVVVKSKVKPKLKTMKERLKEYKGNPLRNNTFALSQIYSKKIPQKKFKVGIVITTHGANNHKMCKMCLDACLKYIHHPKHIFLFDNESSDPWTCKVSEKYKEKPVTYTRIDDQNTNGGLTGTWNMGTKMALEKGCRVVLFLNNDAFVNETVNDLIMLSGYKNDAMIGPLTNQPGYLKNAVRNQFIKSNRLQLRFNYKKIPDYVNGFCFAVHAAALKKNKYDEQHFFNPKLPFSGNEVEWARRHEKKKGNFYICTSCYVEHDKKSSWRNL